jgi:hypothetical protein
MITSPPYAGAIDYTRSQRLSLYLLGFNEDDVSGMGQTEIGARRKRFSSMAETVWADELAGCLEKQLRFLCPDPTVAIVLPHQDHGREEGSIRLGEVFREAKWQLEFGTNRSIRQQRTRQSWTSIKRETIAVYQKVEEVP